MEQQIGNSENTTQNTQDSANETHNKDLSSPKRLIEIEPIEGSPFSLVIDKSGYSAETNEGNKCFIVVGSHRITEAYETEEEAMEQFVLQPWNMTVTLITIVMEKLIELKELNKKMKAATDDKLEDHMKPMRDITQEERAQRGGL